MILFILASTTAIFNFLVSGSIIEDSSVLKWIEVILAGIDIIALISSGGFYLYCWWKKKDVKCEIKSQLKQKIEKI